ncbi:MAG TPA: S8/S53 family peptidase [Mycobacteriales bacterium]|nr:S8/S53 family peptidase [Mycobacteriales bacterium]
MRALRLWLALALVTVSAPVVAVATAAPRPSAAGPGDDAVVVAVIDSGISPYHWDFAAEHMPQAKTVTKADDLPLRRPPHEWLAGFPKPSAFARYAPLNLHLAPRDAKADPVKLYERDQDAWLDLEPSTADEVSYRWIPGTKVIGALAFGALSPPVHGTGTPEHGMGTSSVSTGNLYGTCPECLLVFIQAGSGPDYERAIEWAGRQPWIDVISNSYGLGIAGRDRIYAGSDTEAQRAAIERGQAILFSSGNGVANDFITPNTTLLSSQEGPDWIITVGATDPGDADYTGSGKPADIAGIGTMYPSSYGATDQRNGKNFGGTSNATPTIAGTYARALWLARQRLAGPSRVQSDGVIARGRPTVPCGTARPDCELRDGVLTRRELQTRLFEGATPTPGGFAGRRTVPGSVGGVVPVPPPVGGAPLPFVTTPAVADTRFLSEGHGTYRARVDGTAPWLVEFDRRLWRVLTGDRPAPRRPAGEEWWFRVDSFCRQRIWGTWDQGRFVDEARTPLPPPDPRFPTRTAYQHGCPALTRPPQ